MPKFIHMDENEDGTCTMSICLDPDAPIIVTVLEIDIDTMMASFYRDVEITPEMAKNFQERSVIIPNDLEDL